MLSVRAFRLAIIYNNFKIVTKDRLLISPLHTIVNDSLWCVGLHNSPEASQALWAAESISSYVFLCIEYLVVAILQLKQFFACESTHKKT